MKKYKLAVFDMAGTTVEEGGSVYRTLQQSIKDKGFDASDDKIKQIAGMSKYEAIQYILPDEEAAKKQTVDDIFEVFINRLNKIYREDESITEKEGVSDLFKRLRERGILIALNTGYSRQQADILIKRLHLEKLIDFSITSDEVAKGRPHPDMIQALMKKFGITDSQQIIKVGDTVNDMLEGVNANCGLLVGVLGGAHDEKMLKEAGAHMVLQNTSEMIHHLS